jgi:hypothetical protein
VPVRIIKAPRKTAPPPVTRRSDVGYGRPPQERQFKPGRSGNPKGRPKGVKNFATDVAEELAEKIPITERGRRHQVTKQRALLKALFDKALRGDVRAARVVFDVIPEAEQARRIAVEMHALSKSDQEVLQALREHLAAELHLSKDGSS